MLTRPHTPAVWMLASVGATFAGMLAATVVWNLVDRRADVRAGVRSLLKL